MHNICDLFFKTASCCVAQADLELPGLVILNLSIWSNQTSDGHPVLPNLLICEHGIALIVFSSALISFISIFESYCLSLVFLNHIVF